MPASVRFGKFEVIGRLGYGGMGEVFRARLHEHSASKDHDIALKLLRAEYAAHDHFRDMFTAEARVAGLLNHPNIVRFFDVGQVDGMLYLATELVEGVSVDRVLDLGALDPGVVVFLAVQLLDGLHYAHELRADGDKRLNIVHRDVSASNVLVSTDGAIKLTDFGLAKIEGLSLTLTNEVKGKRAYMAPEQHEGGPMDRRVDVFAMGVLIHELVMGKRPFTDVLDWMRSDQTIRNTPFDAVLTKALALKRVDRWATAADLAAALRAVHPPATDALQVLRERVRRAREGLRPLNKFDQLFLNELATGERSIVRADAPQATIVSLRGDSQMQIKTSPQIDVLSRGSTTFDLTPSDPRPPTSSSLDQHAAETRPNQMPEFAEYTDRLLPRSKQGQPGKPWLLGVALTVLVGLGIGFVAARKRTGETAVATNPTNPNGSTAAPLPPPQPKVTTPVTPPPEHDRPPRPASRVTPTRTPQIAAETNRAPGFLLLDTDPWSAVFLGPKRLGTTPVRIPLPAGRHVLTLQPQNAKKRSLPVVIIAGKEQRLSLHLR